MRVLNGSDVPFADVQRSVVKFSGAAFGDAHDWQLAGSPMAAVRFDLFVICNGLNFRQRPSDSLTFVR